METYRDILEHHGILGMKWGVRRYRNKDGTLTEAGKKRQKTRETKNGQEEIERKVARRRKIVKGALITAATYTLGKAAYERYSNQVAERNNFRKSVDAALGIWEGKNSKALTSPLNVRYTRQTYPSTTKKMTDSVVQKLSNYSLNDLKDLDLY